MSTRMLIDARHPEETRVAVVHGHRVEELDYESASKRQIKGNIYLAKVTRVEPSLQACFVEYGGNRHGFLAFSEIHPDYYQIPVEDRAALLAAEAEEARDEEKEKAKPSRKGKKAKAAEVEADAPSEEQDVEQISGEDDYDDMDRRKASALRRRYKIQEVIKRRQILLVQVVKEERGSKGAALTTYLSLAGRYCVLMPNSPNGGGISRKIANVGDRKKLKDVMSALQVPEGMGCIIRTAGLNRTKAEIKRDYDYLVRLWDGIRERTLSSIAPATIHEEAGLIMRSIRDLYTREVDEILVEGDEGYRAAKDFMKLLMPSHARKVQNYKDVIPLFHRYQVEGQLDSMYSPTVQLKSGGYIVINQTEALVAIDVNSGRSTKEHNIEETALKTNLEASDEVARQLRLRDMAGLIVIDFIDMEDRSNNRAVEKRLKDALKSDRARIQVGRVSAFGLVEMSRQRLRPNLLEGSVVACAHCAGAGVVRSTESAALAILRALEEEGIRDRSGNVTVRAPSEVALYLLNQKRSVLIDLEARYGYRVTVLAASLTPAQGHEVERTQKSAEQLAEEAERQANAPAATAPQASPIVEEEEDEDEDIVEVIEEEEREAAPVAPVASDDEDGRRKKRRRRRRGRRGRGEDGRPQDEQAASSGSEDSAGPATPEADAELGGDAAPPAREAEGEDGRRRRSRRRRRKPQTETVVEVIALGEDGAVASHAATAAHQEAGAADALATESAEPAAEAKKPARRRVRRRKPEAEAAASPEADAGAATAAIVEEAPQAVTAESEAAAPEKPKRSRSRAAPAGKAAPRAKPAKKTEAVESAAEAAAPSPAPAPAVAQAPQRVAEPALVREVITPDGSGRVEAVETEKPDARHRKGWWQRAFGG